MARKAATQLPTVIVVPFPQGANVPAGMEQTAGRPLASPQQYILLAPPQLQTATSVSLRRPPRWVRTLSKFLKILTGGCWVLGGTLLATVVKLLVETPSALVSPALVVNLGLGGLVVLAFGAILWFVAENMYEKDGDDE